MGLRLPNPIAPSGRTIVVSGSMQNDSTPIRCISDAVVGKRAASSWRANDDRLLRGEDETAERPVDGDFESWRDAVGVGRAEHVHAHHVLVGVVQEQAQ